MALTLSIAIEYPGWTAQIPDIESLAHDCVNVSLASAGEMLAPDRPVEIGLLLADDATLRALNRQFRHRDKPTNVLSFPSPPRRQETAIPMILGDIAVSFQTVAAEAARDGKTLRDHARHMIVHGVLHLLGHDHEADNEAEIMETLETRILAGFGVRDPYIIHG